MVRNMMLFFFCTPPYQYMNPSKYCVIINVSIFRWRTQFFISQPTLFGKWDGVFTTTMVNIFGVIVFLRSGWIVAQAGIVNAMMVKHDII